MKWWLLLGAALLGAAIVVLLITMDVIIDKVREVKNKYQLKKLGYRIAKIRKDGGYNVVSVGIYEQKFIFKKKIDDIFIKGKEIDPEVKRNKGRYMVC